MSKIDSVIDSIMDKSETYLFQQLREIEDELTRMAFEYSRSKEVKRMLRLVVEKEVAEIMANAARDRIRQEYASAGLYYAKGDVHS